MTVLLNSWISLRCIFICAFPSPFLDHFFVILPISSKRYERRVISTGDSLHDPAPLLFPSSTQRIKLLIRDQTQF